MWHITFSICCHSESPSQFHWKPPSPQLSAPSLLRSISESSLYFPEWSLHVFSPHYHIPPTGSYPPSSNNPFQMWNYIIPLLSRLKPFKGFHSTIQLDYLFNLIAYDSTCISLWLQILEHTTRIMFLICTYNPMDWNIFLPQKCLFLSNKTPKSVPLGHCPRHSQT